MRSSKVEREREMEENNENLVGLVAGALAVVEPVVKITALFVPLPGLDMALTLVEKIFTVMEQMRYNKKQSRRLAESARDVVEAVEEAMTGIHPEEVDDKLTENVDKLIRTLKRVEETLRDLAGMNFVMRILQHKSIQDDLTALDRECQEASTLFMIKFAIDSKRHQMQNEKARRDDNTALMAELRRIITDQDRIVERIGVRGNKVDSDSKKGIQMLLHKIDNEPGKVPPEVRDFAEEATRTIKSRTNYDVPRSLPWFVRRKEVKQGERIGSGGFSVVYKGYWSTREIPVAIKVFKEQASIDELIKEMVMWRSFDHPFLHPFLGGAPFDRPAFVISPLCLNGNAVEYLRKHSDADRMQILYHISKGMEYLHGHDIVHGDLKARNVLIDDEGRGVVADFGLAKYERHPVESFMTKGASEESKPKTVNLIGTPHWLAPECFLDGEVTKASDMWAFGMTAYELFTNGDIPLGHVSTEEVGKQIHEGLRPEKPEKFPITDSTWSVIEKTWVHEPLARPHFSQLSLVLSIFQRSDINTLRIASEGFAQENWSSGDLSKWPGVAERLVEIITTVLQMGPIQSADGTKDNFAALSPESEDNVVSALKVLVSLAQASGDDPGVGQIIVNAGALPPLLFVLRERSQTVNAEIFRLGCEILEALARGLANDTVSGAITSDEFINALLESAGGSQNQRIALATAQTLMTSSLELMTQKERAITIGILPRLVSVLTSDDSAAIEEACNFISLLASNPRVLDDNHCKEVAPALVSLACHKTASTRSLVYRTIASVIYDEPYFNDFVAKSRARMEIFAESGLFDSMLNMASDAEDAFIEDLFVNGSLPYTRDARPILSCPCSMCNRNNLSMMFIQSSSPNKVGRLLELSACDTRKPLQMLALHLLQQVGAKCDKAVKDDLVSSYGIIDKLMPMLASSDNTISSVSSEAIAVFSSSGGINLLVNLLELTDSNRKRLNMKILNDILSSGTQTEKMQVVEAKSVLPYVCEILKEVESPKEEPSMPVETLNIDTNHREEPTKEQDGSVSSVDPSDAGQEAEAGDVTVKEISVVPSTEEPVAPANSLDIPMIPGAVSDIPPSPQPLTIDARRYAVLSIKELVRDLSDAEMQIVADACIDTGVFIALVDLLSHPDYDPSAMPIWGNDCLFILEQLAQASEERAVEIAKTKLLIELHRVMKGAPNTSTVFSCCNIINQLISTEDYLDEDIVAEIVNANVIQVVVSYIKNYLDGNIIVTPGSDSFTTAPFASPPPILPPGLGSIEFSAMDQAKLLLGLIVTNEAEGTWASLEECNAIQVLIDSFTTLETVDSIFGTRVYVIVDYLIHSKVDAKKLGLHVLGYLLKGNVGQRKSVMNTRGLREALEMCKDIEDVALKKQAHELISMMPAGRRR